MGLNSLPCRVFGPKVRPHLDLFVGLQGMAHSIHGLELRLALQLLRKIKNGNSVGTKYLQAPMQLFLLGIYDNTLMQNHNRNYTSHMGASGYSEWNLDANEQSSGILVMKPSKGLLRCHTPLTCRVFMQKLLPTSYYLSLNFPRVLINPKP